MQTKNAGNILSALKKGDEQAYHDLFRIYFGDLVLYANSILKNTDTAEDIVQELFISFWIDKKFNAIREDLESYLYRSLRNSCLNHQRNEKRRQARIEAIPVETDCRIVLTSEIAENEKERETIYRALHRLPEQCKKIFLLCCVQEMSYQQAADQLGISINTVRTQMGRAFKFLRDALDKKLFLNLLFWHWRKNSTKTHSKNYRKHRLDGNG